MLKDRKDCMAEIDKAISRYDGHTTYAKMANIVQILVSPLFDEKPACYVAELIPEIQRMLGREDSASNTKKRVAADAHIRHGISLGLLESVISSGVASHHGLRSKIDETSLITITFLGRACRAAIKQGDGDFKKFLLTHALLEHDFDMYGLLIALAVEGGARNAIKGKFTKKVTEIYRQRKQWLNEMVRMAPMGVKARFQKHMGEDARNPETTIRYHFDLRVEWAQYLEHIHKSKVGLSASNSGNALAKLIHDRIGGNSMFWIAPTPECIKKTGMVGGRAEKVFSAWDILRPPGEEGEPCDEVIEKMAEFMRSAYAHIRLRMFNQAPLGAIIPYVHFLEHQQNAKVYIKKTFQAVLRLHRDEFSCILGAVPHKNLYQLRATRK